MKNILKYTYLLVITLYLMVPCSAFADQGEWWNEAWEYRQKIAFDTTPSGADTKENINDFPLLLKLHTGNFNFANAKDDGTDIRFITSDGQTLLMHHIERYDTIDEMALIWIKLPRVSADTATEYIWMYYGNNDAAGGQDITGTYPVDQVLVMHLDEIEGKPKDSTAYKNNAVDFKGGLGLPSIIGTGATIAAVDDAVVIANSPSMDFSSGFTFTSWIRANDGLTDAVLFSMKGDTGELKIAVEDSMVYGTVTSDTGTVVTTEKTTGISPMTWQHLCVTVIPNGRITITVDGIESTWADMNFSMPALTGDMVIGNSSDHSKPFLGDMDEIRISKSAKSQSFIRLSHVTEGPVSKFLVVEGEEINEGGGMPVFYLGAIVKEISLDGWVVIILLILFAIASWVIIISKGVNLFFIEKENKQFMESYLKKENPLENRGSEDEFDNSPICRLNKAGCDNMQNIIKRISGQNKGVTQKDINRIRTFLDEGFIREEQKLNSLVVVLTMAISGGPFLGLLGTVWGVMNTFAAMAEAGEANIMAIAPGVASALSTTVFGLIVAIPALFGYNYIASKVKGVTADMDIFIEKFILKIEEVYGDDK